MQQKIQMMAQKLNCNLALLKTLQRNKLVQLHDPFLREQVQAPTGKALRGQCSVPKKTPQLAAVLFGRQVWACRCDAAVDPYL
jgi:hypothetical protein